MKFEINLTKEATKRGLEIYFYDWGNTRRQKTFSIMLIVALIFTGPLFYLNYQTNNKSGMILIALMAAYFVMMLYRTNGKKRLELLRKHIEKNYDKMVQKNPEFPFEQTVALELFESQLEMSFDVEQTDAIKDMESEATVDIDGEVDDLIIDDKRTPGMITFELDSNVKLLVTNDTYVYVQNMNMPVIIEKAQLSQEQLEKLEEIINNQTVNKVVYNF